jgi:hypothetical protein
MSRYDVVAKEPDKYAVTVSWDRPLQTYFAQVIHKDSDRDYDMALWKGTNPREIGSVTDLQQALKDYADIPKGVQNALQFDMGPLEQWREPERVSRNAEFKAERTDMNEQPTKDGCYSWDIFNTRGQLVERMGPLGEGGSGKWADWPGERTKEEALDAWAGFVDYMIEVVASFVNRSNAL